MPSEPLRCQPAWVASQALTAASSSLAGRVMARIYASLSTRPSTRVARAMILAVLFACPFCREMFDRSERRACAVCGVALVPLDRLPLSDDARAIDDEPDQPEHDPLPLTYLGRGRGALAALAVAGLVAFV